VLLLCAQIDREEKLHESIQRRRTGQPDRCFELRREVQTARFKSKRGGEGKTEPASRELDWGEKLRETRHGNAWGNLSGSSEVDRGGNFAARFRYGQGSNRASIGGVNGKRGFSAWRKRERRG
jgi:hypothetical protein